MKTKGAARKQRPPLLLLVDGAKREYGEALKAAGYRVITVPGIKEAFASRARPDAVIVEMVVPDGDLSRLNQILGSERRTRAMTVIALAGEERKDALMKAGAMFCRYPCPPEELVEFVKRTLALGPP